MVDFSFDGLFKTTNMGIPSLSPLPTQTSLSKSYYGYSITVQSIILLYFVAYFGLSIIRVIKKLKNQKFRDLEEELIQLQDGHNNKEYVISQQKTQKNTYSQGKQEGQDNRPKLIPYRFDGEQEQKNRKRQRLRHLPEMDKDKEGIDDENKVIEENNEDYNSYHDEKEQYYIQLDNKLMFLQPFLISFIICNNMFVADIITVLAMVLMFLSYYLFNVKECLSNIKITPLLFMLFSLFGYISFFINDHDLTT